MKIEPLIDARGLRRPWPALRLARAMREHAAATIVADDPMAAGEIAALAAERGWTVDPIETGIGRGFVVAGRNSRVPSTHQS